MALATSHARKAAALAPPEMQLTIMVADTETQRQHNQTWSTTMGSKCSGESNFPLALRQQRQEDSHQLYYNYALIKVSPSVLEKSAVLQTYNLRINVTSRLYFEVGMHLLNAHVTLQLTTLGGSGYAIQGKQRGNLNVLDIQLGPGDYSVALKQASLPGRQYLPTCGLFSLQGLVEPINLMSAAANSGEILQRSINYCPEAADGDILPPKIFGSKSRTRGGGELHVDATGHFMRRFRNVLFKQSRESTPEYDFVELEPVEDSLLHLAFLYRSEGDLEIVVKLTDTLMMGQEAHPHSSFKLADIEGGHTELVAEYKLTKGRHYSLTVFYVGGLEMEEQGCTVYDLTLSISHIPKILEQTTCKGERPSLKDALKHVITDRDLDHEGQYSFDKTVKLQYPEDFKKVTKVADGSNAVMEWVSIDLSTNYDLRASVDFEFDEGLFALGFTESVKSDSGEWQTAVSHEQGPLVFKQNNDHYLTVRREIVAEGVESESRTRKHTLTITDRQPDLLHLLDTDRSDKGAPPTCVNLQVKIYI